MRRQIVSHTEPLDYRAFSRNEWTVDAVLHNFTVIGESAKALPEELPVEREDPRESARFPGGGR